MTAAPIEGFRSLARALRLSPLAAMLLFVLATLDVAAFAFAIVSLIGPDQTAPTQKTDWRPPSVVSPSSGRAAAASDDAQTLARPIFWKSRRPRPQIAKVGDNAGAGSAALAGLSLAAIVKTGGSTRAFVVSAESPEGRWLAQGETVQGWTIADVGEFELKLVSGVQSARLQLYPEH